MRTPSPAGPWSTDVGHRAAVLGSTPSVLEVHAWVSVVIASRVLHMALFGCSNASLSSALLRLIGHVNVIAPPTDQTQANPARYMDTVAALQPDMYVTLADEVRTVRQWGAGRWQGCRCTPGVRASSAKAVWALWKRLGVGSWGTVY